MVMKACCGRSEAGQGCVWGVILRSTVRLPFHDPRSCDGFLHANGILRFCVVMRYVIAVIFSNFSLVAINDRSFGRHPPSPLDDRLMVKFEPLYSS